VPPDPAPAEPQAAGPTKAAAPASRGEEETALHRAFDGAPALRVVRGEAAYYGDRFAGRKTASGERYDPKAFTAAHRTFPFGTIVRVRRPDTGSYTYVRVTDRGPFGSKTRIIDVSKIAARRLDMFRRGVVDVRVVVVRWGDSKRPR
jgi:rare lipoprotein A